MKPPINGATIMNEFIHNSHLINSSFITKFFNISTSTSLENISIFEFKKCFIAIKIYYSLFINLIANNYDLVYLTLSPFGFGFFKDSILCLILKIFKVKIVFHLHGKGIDNVVNTNRFVKAYYCFIFNNVDVIHLSECLVVDIKSVFDKSKSIYIVNNGILGNPFKAGEKILGRSLNIIFFSNLEEEKGAHILLLASMLIPKDMQNRYTISIFGATKNLSYLGYLEKLIEYNPNKNCFLMGPKYGLDKFSIFSAADIFVLPTYFRNECFPLVILEAMDSGLAIISTREGAIPSMITSGFSGELIDFPDPHLLALAMQRLIANDDYRLLCGKNAKIIFDDKYHLDEFEKSLTKVLKNILE